MRFRRGRRSSFGRGRRRSFKRRGSFRGRRPLLRVGYRM